jgi:hypothetical protein
VRAVKLSARNVGGILAVVVGAVLVPTALAVAPDDRAEPRGPGALAATSVATSVRPDDRAEARGPGVLSPSEAQPADPGWTTTEPVVTTESTGIDWTYVALAGIIAAAVTLLVIAAVETARHHEGPGRLAPH